MKEKERTREIVRTMENIVSYSSLSVVRGYHVYHWQWRAVLGDVLEAMQEHENRKDGYYVAYLKNEK